MRIKELTLAFVELTMRRCFGNKWAWQRIDILSSSRPDVLEWRNWQTHGTQNPAGFTSHVGSTPTSSTICF